MAVLQALETDQLGLAEHLWGGCQVREIVCTRQYIYLDVKEHHNLKHLI